MVENNPYLEKETIIFLSEYHDNEFFLDANGRMFSYVYVTETMYFVGETFEKGIENYKHGKTHGWDTVLSWVDPQTGKIHLGDRRNLRHRILDFEIICDDNNDTWDKVSDRIKQWIDTIEIHDINVDERRASLKSQIEKFKDMYYHQKRFNMISVTIYEECRVVLEFFQKKT